jgi:hypothetical protein
MKFDHAKNGTLLLKINIYQKIFFLAVLRIRIRRIRMFLGLPDPCPDLLEKGTDPDPSIIKKNINKKLDSCCFVTFFMTFYLRKMM